MNSNSFIQVQKNNYLFEFVKTCHDGIKLTKITKLFPFKKKNLIKYPAATLNKTASRVFKGGTLCVTAKNKQRYNHGI